LIGGLIAARWVKPGARGRAIIAGTIGVGLSSVGPVTGRRTAGLGTELALGG
jgi:hypothetical protein